MTTRTVPLQCTNIFVPFCYFHRSSNRLQTFLQSSSTDLQTGCKAFYRVLPQIFKQVANLSTGFFHRSSNRVQTFLVKRLCRDHQIEWSRDKVSLKVVLEKITNICAVDIPPRIHLHVKLSCQANTCRLVLKGNQKPFRSQTESLPD